MGSGFFVYIHEAIIQYVNSILQYIRSFVGKEWHAGYMLCVLVLVGLLIYFNYWHGLEPWLVAGKPFAARFAGYFCLYGIPFAGAFLLQRLFYRGTAYFSSGWFWFMLLAAPALFAWRVSFNFHEPVVAALFDQTAWLFWLKCISLVLKVLLLLLPVLLIWYLKDRRQQPLYGVRAAGKLSPYGWMLLLMLPLIAWAATQHDFQRVYPKAAHLGIGDGAGWKYLLYECCYGFDFISIEFFFRGFLLMALVRYTGTKVIIPAACFYCSIHLGKPMAEAISSFWGGLLLGIIACNTGSVWGGLLVHLGIAWMMELAGWLIPML